MVSGVKLNQIIIILKIFQKNIQSAKKMDSSPGSNTTGSAVTSYVSPESREGQPGMAVNSETRQPQSNNPLPTGPRMCLGSWMDTEGMS